MAVRQPRADYPTWRNCGKNLSVSHEEGADGMPDWSLMRGPETNRWYVHGRVTGFMHSPTFPSRAAAKTYVEEQGGRPKSS